MNEEVSEYRNKNRKKLLWMSILFVAMIVVATYSICVTQYSISFSRAIEIIINHINGEEPQNYWDRLEKFIVIDSLCPRAVGGVLVGLILGICGTLMQSTIRNPLADPYTTGISSGALLGVTLFTVFGFSVIPSANENVGLIVSAFSFALIPCILVISISSFKRVTSTTIVLIGIAVMYVFNAFSTLIRYTASDEDVASIYAWSVGLLGRMNWESSVYLLIVFILLFVVSIYAANTLNVLAMEDKMCSALGVNPQRTRLLIMVLVAVATATAVCFVGTIGFIGLIAPHIGRIFVGSDNKYLIPASAIIGAFILISADSVARIITTTGLPVGVVTSAIGGPIFLIILLRQRKSAWGDH